MAHFRIARTLLAASLLVCACDSAARNAESRSVAPAWPHGRGWHVAATPSAVIGEVDGSPDYQFNHVGGALVVADSLIVVGDQLAGQIRYYTRDGVHVRTVGRKGEGPGEYKNIQWIGMHGDSIVVWDLFTARVTVLNPDGSLSRTTQAAKADGHLYFAAGLLGDGSLLLREPHQERLVTGEHVDSIGYLRVSTSDGAILGRLGPYLRGEQFTAGDYRTNLTDWVIFGRQGIVVGAPQGIFVGATDQFKLVLHTNDGRAVRSIGRPWHSRRASKEDIAAVREQQRDGYTSAARNPAIARVLAGLYSNLPHRDTLPAFTRALVDNGGNLWMEEFRIDPEAAGTWSVFDPAGRWLGEVQTPAGVKVMSIGRDVMIGVTIDDLNVERVVIYPLIR